MKINYQKICNDLGIKLIYESLSGRTDGGASTTNTIYLFPCSKKWIEELSFWHELGHILLNKSKLKAKTNLSTLSCEGAAWELGLNAAATYGRMWEYNSKEMKWARKQLATYVNSEYDDLKEYYKRK